MHQNDARFHHHRLSCGDGKATLDIGSGTMVIMVTHHENLLTMEARYQFFGLIDIVAHAEVAKHIDRVFVPHHRIPIRDKLFVHLRGINKRASAISDDILVAEVSVCNNVPFHF